MGWAEYVAIWGRRVLWEGNLKEVGSWVVVLKINLKGMGLGGNGLIDLAKYRDKK